MDGSFFGSGGSGRDFCTTPPSMSMQDQQMNQSQSDFHQFIGNNGNGFSAMINDQASFQNFSNFAAVTPPTKNEFDQTGTPGGNSLQHSPFLSNHSGEVFMGANVAGGSPFRPVLAQSVFSNNNAGFRIAESPIGPPAPQQQMSFGSAPVFSSPFNQIIHQQQLTPVNQQLNTPELVSTPGPSQFHSPSPLRQESKVNVNLARATLNLPTTVSGNDLLSEITSSAGITPDTDRPIVEASSPQVQDSRLQHYPESPAGAVYPATRETINDLPSMISEATAVAYNFESDPGQVISRRPQRTAKIAAQKFLDEFRSEEFQSAALAPRVPKEQEMSEMTPAKERSGSKKRGRKSSNNNGPLSAPVVELQVDKTPKIAIRPFDPRLFTPGAKPNKFLSHLKRVKSLYQLKKAKETYCSICEKFIAFGGMERHVSMHFGGPLYACRLCTFVNHAPISSHVSQNHAVHANASNTEDRRFFYEEELIQTLKECFKGPPQGCASPAQNEVATPPSNSSSSSNLIQTAPSQEQLVTRDSSDRVSTTPASLPKHLPVIPDIQSISTSISFGSSTQPTKKAIASILESLECDESGKVGDQQQRGMAKHAMIGSISILGDRKEERSIIPIIQEPLTTKSNPDSGYDTSPIGDSPILKEETVVKSSEIVTIDVDKQGCSNRQTKMDSDAEIIETLPEENRRILRNKELPAAVKYVIKLFGKWYRMKRRKKQRNCPDFCGKRRLMPKKGAVSGPENRVNKVVKKTKHEKTRRFVLREMRRELKFMGCKLPFLRNYLDAVYQIRKRKRCRRPVSCGICGRKLYGSTVSGGLLGVSHALKHCETKFCWRKGKLDVDLLQAFLLKVVFRCFRKDFS